MSQTHQTCALKWGHPAYTPDGRELRLPQRSMITLRRLGLLRYNPALHGQQISSTIQEFLKPDYDAITGDLRAVLGPKLDGPAVLVCRCRSCRRKFSESANDLEHLLAFRSDMKRQRGAY